MTRPGGVNRRGSDALLSALSHVACGLAALLFLSGWAGCTYTVAGDTPEPIEAPRPSFQPTVEHTVAEFSFALGSGDMATAIFDGRLLSIEIMESWQDRGYVRAQQYVADASFSGTADYHLLYAAANAGRPASRCS